MVNSTWMDISAVGLSFLWGWEGLGRNTCEILRMDLHRRQRKPDSDTLTHTVFLIKKFRLYGGFQNYSANKRANKKRVLIGFFISQPFCWLINLSANHIANNCRCKKSKGSLSQRIHVIDNLHSLWLWNTGFSWLLRALNEVTTVHCEYNGKLKER